MLTTEQKQGRIALLEADPSLSDGLSPERELDARERIVVQIVEVPKGTWDPPPPTEPDGHLGYLLLTGLLMREVAVGESRSVEVLNSGDLLRPWQEDPTSFSSGRWNVLEDLRLAVLDSDVAEAIAAHPELVGTLVARTICRARNLAVHLAIANTVGLEKRILMLFRHLAERWGKVTPDGIALPLRLTHQMVADLVGARRPSATTAIVRLAERDELMRTTRGGWLLRPAGVSSDDSE